MTDDTDEKLTPLAKLPGDLLGKISKGPLGLTFAGLYILLYILLRLLGAIETLHNKLITVFGLDIPYSCILILLAGAVVVLAIVEQLRRRKKPGKIIARPEGEGDGKLAFPKGSPGRKRLWWGLILSTAACAILVVWAWWATQQVPKLCTGICIYVDPFDLVGWEDYKVNERIEMAIREELDSILPGGKIDLLRLPKESDTVEQRLDMACKAGAALLIWGTGDKHEIRPHIRLCSPKAPELKLEDYEIKVSALDISAGEFGGSKYAGWSDLDEARDYCVIDSLLPVRIKYLAALSLGLIFLYEDIPNVAEGFKIEKADALFSRALELEEDRDRQDCELDYCDALLYYGICKQLLQWTQSKMQVVELRKQAVYAFSEALRLRPDFYAAIYSLGVALSEYAQTLPPDSARVCFQSSFVKHAEAARLNPRDHQVYNNWGCALMDYARMLQPDSAGPYFDSSFAKFAEAVRIRPDSGDAYYNWGTALSAYARVLPPDSARTCLQSSFIKYARAVRIDPQRSLTFNNWGNALSDYARKQPRDSAGPYFDSSFAKYAEAVRINPDDHEAFYNWGTALQDYARTLPPDSARAYYRSSFDKHAEAARINPDDHKTYYNWANALSFYARTLPPDSARVYFQSSFVKYAQAVRSNPNLYLAYLAYNNWAASLWIYASMLPCDSAVQYMKESFDKYAAALSIMKQDFKVFPGWGLSLLLYYSLVSGIPNSMAIQRLQPLSNAVRNQDIEVCYLELEKIIDIVAQVDTTLYRYKSILAEIKR